MLAPRNNVVTSISSTAYVCSSCRSRGWQVQLPSRSSDRQFSRRQSNINVVRSSEKTLNNSPLLRGDVKKMQNTNSRCGRRLRTNAVQRRSTGTTTNGGLEFQTRAYHASSRLDQQISAASLESDEPPPQSYFTTPAAPSSSETRTTEDATGIRARLRKWNVIYGQETPALDPLSFGADTTSEQEISNDLTRIPDSNAPLSHEGGNDDAELQGFYNSMSREGFDGEVDHQIFLKLGDLVEIPFPSSERESVLAVFVRRVRGLAQCFTMHGRWTHFREGGIPYSIPGWIAPALVEPIIAHLPNESDLEDMEALTLQATMEDLSVPRSAARPVVARLVAFHDECQTIYRQHAESLDAAHDILAHPTDLRYGSLTSAATTLLQTPAEKLPLPALFTVRKAISNAGYGFNIENGSHRLTGYMQILSKRNVKAVEQVRTWLREWQDDVALTTSMTTKQRAQHYPLRGAQIVHQYIEKARSIVQKSRETRSPTPYGTVSPSSVHLPITPDSSCVRVILGNEFNPAEMMITRFIEAWCTSFFMRGHPRLIGLSPLLLQATGLYPGMELTSSTGHIFLQEIGCMMPYDNRKRFDPHLLLPTSQHSRPLMLLSKQLGAMSKSHGFSDSMAHLRRDWGSLPVYCIDKADAQEIDDGLSVERAGTGADGKAQYWLHIHVANPTAFFSRDHPMATMARHMVETVYTPERTYPMLPKWASRYHFSLDNNRPCLTLSAKLDEDGNTLEHTITNGFVRNAMRLTPDEVNTVLQAPTSDSISTLVLRVGGEPRPAPQHESRAGDITAEHKADLRIIQQLAEKRFAMRKATGGIFFDIPRPDVRVWQDWTTPALPWDHQYRLGSRRVEGDPVIECRTQEFRNWFNPQTGTSETLVREMMLLACETAAKWCAERRIPIIYRGTTRNPEGPTPAEFRRDVLLPTLGEHGEIPMHLGLRYMKTLGPSILRTSPLAHEVMGMEHYSKVTSPLRRYGDMILHWQIEATLRYEASTQQSLVNHAPASGSGSSSSSSSSSSSNGTEQPDRGFLPFSVPALETVISALRPRERIIMLAKRNSERFWWLMLLMRMHYFGESGGLPFKKLHILVTTDPLQQGAHGSAIGICLELNVYFQIMPPSLSGLGKLKVGDTWECTMGEINTYQATACAIPVRLLERPGS